MFGKFLPHILHLILIVLNADEFDQLKKYLELFHFTCIDYESVRQLKNFNLFGLSY